MIFDKFRKKKADEISFPEPMPVETNMGLPEDLERFRVRPAEQRLPEIRPERLSEPRNDYPVPELPPSKSVDDLVAERTQVNKIDLILQKLETIDTRLRLMEEKTKKY
ncbi:MAG: hypothetical protein V1678_00175 [Candidatus Aenigmatarchaeota archaeon]